VILFKDINEGDILFEIVYGKKIVFEVRTQPINNGNLWFFSGKEISNLPDNKEIDFLQTEGLTHYGPDLYRQERE
jgi:hypothetical protein